MAKEDSQQGGALGGTRTDARDIHRLDLATHTQDPRPFGMIIERVIGGQRNSVVSPCGAAPAEYRPAVPNICNHQLVAFAGACNCR
jgi:hypothetical protein